MSRPHLPAKRLSGFYFAYFAAIGVLVPYVGLYLQARGFTPAQIGIALGLLAITRIVAPYGWGAVADARGRMPVMRLTLLGALGCFLVLPFAPGTAWVMAAITLYGLFVNGTMAQAEVVTFAHLAERPEGYARIRLWGSLGFLVLVLALGPVLDTTGVLPLPYWIALFFAAALLVAQRVPEPPSTAALAAQAPVAAEASVLAVLRRPPVLALLATALLGTLSFQPYYGFYSLYLQDHGYSKAAIGLLWALGVVAEVVLFWWLPRVARQPSLAQLLVASQAATALRWLLTPLLVGSVAASAGVQLLHAVSFGAYHLAVVNLVQRYFPVRLQGRGQAILIGVSYGVGGALGGWGAGQLWERMDTDHIWFVAAGVAALATVVAACGVREDPLPGGERGG